MPTEHPVAVWRAPYPAAVLPPDGPGQAELNPSARNLLGDAQACARFASALATQCAETATLQFDFERWHVRAEVMPADAHGARVVWLDFGPIAATGRHATAEQLSLALGLAGLAILGLGVSGPQVVEGLHGVPFAHPYDRLREYLQIMKLAFTGEKLVHQGPEEDHQGGGDEGHHRRHGCHISARRIGAGFQDHWL